MYKWDKPKQALVQLFPRIRGIGEKFRGSKWTGENHKTHGILRCIDLFL
jgi:hypothetical protein